MCVCVCVCVRGGGGGGNWFYVTSIPALSSAAVYTRHLFSPREGLVSERNGEKQLQKQSLRIGFIRALNECTGKPFKTTTQHNINIPDKWIERKAMIRNRYNDLTPSIQDTKGKEERTQSNSTTIKTLQAESKKDSFFPKNWPYGYPKYIFLQDIQWQK